MLLQYYLVQYVQYLKIGMRHTDIWDLGDFLRYDLFFSYLILALRVAGAGHLLRIKI